MRKTFITRAAACALAAALAAPAAARTDPECGSAKAAPSETAPPGRLAELMTKGKLESDLGHDGNAVRAFEEVARDAAAPDALRWEALVRLGIAQGRAGDLEKSFQSFREVAARYGNSPEAMRFLTLAVAGVVPGCRRWEGIWKEVRVAVVRGANGPPRPGIVWPGSASASGTSTDSPYRGEPISLTLDDADVRDVLKRFSDLTGLKITIDPDVQGTVTARLSSVPWDEAFERILESQGLAYHLDGSSMRVAARETLDKEAPERKSRAR